MAALFACIFLFYSLSCCTEVFQYIPILQKGDLDSTSACYLKCFLSWVLLFYRILVLSNTGHQWNVGKHISLYNHLISFPIACIVVIKVINFYQFCKMVIWSALLPVIPMFLCPGILSCPGCLFLYTTGPQGKFGRHFWFLFSPLLLSYSLSCCPKYLQYIPIQQNGDLDSTSNCYSKFSQ